ncbi:TerC family protein [Yimella sp. cx-573]|nr:TerC family protein [Yimella sp. cx-573]
MNVTSLVWILTIAGIIGLLLFDFFFHVRQAHEPTLKESATWSALYVGVALLFGAGLWFVAGSGHGTDYFAGYITEKALSVDNLFVFLVIIGSFKVPRAYQQKVLLVGIAIALVARAAFVFLGAAMINTFSWTFYFFGLVLLVTAGHMLKPEGTDEHDADNIVSRIAKKFFKASDEYDGDKLFTRINGRRVMTPMLLVMIVIGGTDILFALDAIPAIYGLTEEPYIVFTATAFSLLGLRQLYFLIDELLDRLIYLSYGLAVILGVIGVKLMLHALHKNSLPFINNGAPVDVIELSTGASLGIIVGVLVITVIASLVASGRQEKSGPSKRLENDDRIDEGANI